MTRPTLHRLAPVIVAAVSCGVVVIAATRVVLTQSPQAAGAALKNPVASTPESIAAGKKAYDTNCAACHGDRGQGAVKAGTPISIIQEQDGKQPPDLTETTWDHGGTDGEIYTVIKQWCAADDDGRVGRPDLGHRDLDIVNYLRALANELRAAAPSAGPASSSPRPTLELADYVQMPVTADMTARTPAAELARVNFLREEPGGRRFFVTDLNGPLYILDKQTKAFTTYLDFNGLADVPACSSGSPSSATSRPG